MQIQSIKSNLTEIIKENNTLKKNLDEQNLELQSQIETFKKDYNIINNKLSNLEDQIKILDTKLSENISLFNQNKINKYLYKDDNSVSTLKEININKNKILEINCQLNDIKSELNNIKNLQDNVIQIKLKELQLNIDKININNIKDIYKSDSLNQSDRLNQTNSIGDIKIDVNKDSNDNFIIELMDRYYKLDNRINKIESINQNEKIVQNELNIKNNSLKLDNISVNISKLSTQLETNDIKIKNVINKQNTNDLIFTKYDNQFNNLNQINYKQNLELEQIKNEINKFKETLKEKNNIFDNFSKYLPKLNINQKINLENNVNKNENDNKNIENNNYEYNNIQNNNNLNLINNNMINNQEEIDTSVAKKIFCDEYNCDFCKNVWNKTVNLEQFTDSLQNQINQINFRINQNDQNNHLQQDNILQYNNNSIKNQRIMNKQLNNLTGKNILEIKRNSFNDFIANNYKILCDELDNLNFEFFIKSFIEFQYIKIGYNNNIFNMAEEYTEKEVKYFKKFKEFRAYQLLKHIDLFESDNLNLYDFVINYKELSIQLIQNNIVKKNYCLICLKENHKGNMCTEIFQIINLLFLHWDNKELKDYICICCGKVHSTPYDKNEEILYKCNKLKKLMAICINTNINFNQTIQLKNMINIINNVKKFFECQKMLWNNIINLFVKNQKCSFFNYWINKKNLNAVKNILNNNITKCFNNDNNLKPIFGYNIQLEATNVFARFFNNNSMILKKNNKNGKILSIILNTNKNKIQISQESCIQFYITLINIIITNKIDKKISMNLPLDVEPIFTSNLIKNSYNKAIIENNLRFSDIIMKERFLAILNAKFNLILESLQNNFKKNQLKNKIKNIKDKLICLKYKNLFIDPSKQILRNLQRDDLLNSTILHKNKIILNKDNSNNINNNNYINNQNIGLSLNNLNQFNNNNNNNDINNQNDNLINNNNTINIENNFQKNKFKEEYYPDLNDDMMNSDNDEEEKDIIDNNTNNLNNPDFNININNSNINDNYQPNYDFNNENQKINNNINLNNNINQGTNQNDNLPNVDSSPPININNINKDQTNNIQKNNLEQSNLKNNLFKKKINLDDY